ncbi:hypothetical protein M501DRAFT_992982 [Patellaria atrata CBS 101060]|uniref:T6SS Phospholipase effector Tle1-like catalytic domain-containing protein n=1 Tax=Patellaria atrata CBS 101060 TaxID=1346257 RepID=A0A9P4VQA0_9PEZI|nr:hypothetical protein M501DRAFT_992982 [Patellaria atrata CBS 101060]
MASAFYDKVAISSEVKPQPKRIIICCDGTWQSAVSLDPSQGCPSNVARISRIIAKAGVDQSGKEWQQVVYYDAGVGSGAITEYEKKRQGGLGIGLLENVIEAYNFIVNNYSPGDQLFFFGFSRGAYTVRAAAGLVIELGVIKPSCMRRFLEMYSHYIKAEKFEEGFSKYSEWQTFTSKYPVYIERAEAVTIQAIGVFDTVGALGVPDVGHIFRKDNSRLRKAYQFHNTNLSDNILHAYQALALDERREPFEPSIWKLKSGAKTKLCQCWFPGAHVNVGGGSSDNADEANPKGDREQLASISYAWMLDRVRPHLAFDEAALEIQKVEIRANAQPPPVKVEEKKSEGWFWDSYNYVKDTVVGGTKKAAEYIPYGMGQIDDSHTFLYDVMGNPKDRDANVINAKQIKKRMAIEEGKLDSNTKDDFDGEYTVERVHPSVFFRQVYEREQAEKAGKKGKDVKYYEPAAMRGWERIYVKGDSGRDFKARNGFKWVKYEKDKNGKIVKDKQGKDKIVNFMWEFEIGHMPEAKSVEKFLIDQSWTESVHNEVQKGWRDS